MIVSLTSVRGSPGVSAWSLLIAAAWSRAEHTDRIVVEADTAGGVAAARYGVGSNPGAAQLLSALRGGAEAPADVGSFARHLGAGGWLVPGPETAEAASSVWHATGSAANAAAALSVDPRLWLFDLGRAGPNDVAAPVLRASAAVLVLSRGDHASLVQLPSRLGALRADGCDVVVLVAGRTPFDLDEIAEFCDAPVLPVPSDPQLVSLAGAVWTSRRARRGPVWRAAVVAATTVGERVTAEAMRAAVDLLEDADAR